MDVWCPTCVRCEQFYGSGEDGKCSACASDDPIPLFLSHEERIAKITLDCQWESVVSSKMRLALHRLFIANEPPAIAVRFDLLRAHSWAYGLEMAIVDMPLSSLNTAQTALDQVSTLLESANKHQNRANIVTVIANEIDIVISDFSSTSGVTVLPALVYAADALMARDRAGVLDMCGDLRIFAFVADFWMLDREHAHCYSSWTFAALPSKSNKEALDRKWISHTCDMNQPGSFLKGLVRDNQ